MARRKSCAAPIVWVKTTSGRAMPLDVTPTPDGNVIVEDGLARVLTDAEEWTGDRRRSHFATCPDATQHRKKA